MKLLLICGGKLIKLRMFWMLSVVLFKAYVHCASKNTPIRVIFDVQFERQRWLKKENAHEKWNTFQSWCVFLRHSVFLSSEFCVHCWTVARFHKQITGVNLKQCICIRHLRALYTDKTNPSSNIIQRLMTRTTHQRMTKQAQIESSQRNLNLDGGSSFGLD